MRSILRDVGELIHTYKEHNLKLVTNCSVQLSVPEKSATAPSISSQLERLTYRDIWLARGAGLQICVQLSLTESITSSLDKPSLVEGLGLALRNAEIWPQLCLQASLTISSADDGPASSTADILLSLTYAQDSKKGLRYVSRTQPPEGVAQGGLCTVNISFCLSEISTGELKTKKRTRYQQAKGHGIDVDSLLLDDYESANGARFCMSQPTPSTLQTFDTSLEEYRSASQPVYLSDEDLLDGSYSPGHDINSFQSILSNPGGATNSISGSDWVRKRARKRRADDKLLHAELGLHQLVELTDIALRTLICDNRMSAPVGIKCLSKSVGPKLSEIAPALFSPGYYYAISQRSQFLPRIAHVFSCMQRRTTSTSLRKKLDCVAALRATGLILGDQAWKPGDPNHVISCQVEARLWGMLQRTLFDRLAARKLEHLTVPDRGPSFDPMLSEEMLDELLLSSHGPEHGSLTGVEDDDLPFSDFFDVDEDDPLLLDAMDVVNDDDPLDTYQDQDCAIGRVELGSAEPSHDPVDIERPMERIDKLFTTELCEREKMPEQIVHYIVNAADIF